MDKPKNNINDTPSIDAVMGQPEDAFELINKYGTYNIQPTNDTTNPFPGISQGLSKDHKKQLTNEAEQWNKNQNKKAKGG